MKKKQVLVCKKEIKLLIPGQPRPKLTGQAGLAFKGKKPFPIIKKNPANEEAEKNIQRAFFLWLVDDSELNEPWEGPFAYKHTYYFEMTKEEKKKFKNFERIIHTKKPDTDNLHKMSNDALEGFIFKNDSAGIDKGGEKFSWHSPGLSVLRFYLLETREVEVNG